MKFAGPTAAFVFAASVGLVAFLSLISLPTAGFCSFGTEPICFMSAVSSPLGPT